MAAGLTLASGLIHGRMSNRWVGDSKIADTAVEKLGQLPDRFGDWQGQALEDLPENTVIILECMGHSIRTYVNQETGESVRVAIILGPAGPMSVHTPEICYSSRNQKVKQQRQRVAVPKNGNDEFWALTFQSTDVDARLLRVYYAWTTGHTWTAADDPRWGFAGNRYLYKIQLSGNVSAESKNDPCRNFLREFIPAARLFLVEPSSD